MTTPSVYKTIREHELTQVERLVRHLALYPQDLIDARWLMQRYCISAAGFQQALQLLEQSSAPPYGEAFRL